VTIVQPHCSKNVWFFLLLRENFKFANLSIHTRKQIL
jgi:hypothetical protein